MYILAARPAKLKCLDQRNMISWKAQLPNYTYYNRTINHVFRTFSTNLILFCKIWQLGTAYMLIQDKIRKKDTHECVQQGCPSVSQQNYNPPCFVQGNFQCKCDFQQVIADFFSPLDNCFEWIPEGICCTRNFFSYSSNPNTLSWPGSQNIHHVIRYKSVP